MLIFHHVLGTAISEELLYDILYIHTITEAGLSPTIKLQVDSNQQLSDQGSDLEAIPPNIGKVRQPLSGSLKGN